MPTSIHAKQALLRSGWVRDVRLTFDSGRISSVSTGAPPDANDDRVGYLIPGMSNVHSHAFQRGMAGLAEIRGPAEDTFWSWRQVMYHFALRMTPDDAESVAAQLYMEMLEAGFTRVGEFHYLHHDKNGHRYDDLAEMADRIGAAAERTGIALTLLPVFYAHANFGGTAPTEGQRRFVNSIDDFANLFDRCRAIMRNLPGATLGVAPHSLRAVTPEELAAVIALAETGPIHMHIAEQVKEIEDCVAWSGRRPISWLFEHVPVDRRWCLIHATHMTPDETSALASSGAVAGLCPVTEANLGDGFFPAADYRAAGGTFGVGSDSNVLIGIGDELRQLEYSQRLTRRSRNVLTDPGKSTAAALFGEALSGGARALGVEAGIDVGQAADLVHLASADNLDLDGDTLLDSWIFAARARAEDVWVGGRKVVKAGRHVSRDTISYRFQRAMSRMIAN